MNENINIKNKADLNQKSTMQTRVLERLVRLKKTNINNVHSLIILLMLLLFPFFIYFVFRSYYDVYVIFLFAPLIYSAIVYRIPGAIIVSVIFVGILVPHVQPTALDIYTLVRGFVYIVFPFLVGTLVAISLNSFENQIKAYREIVALNETLNDYLDRLEKTQKQMMQVEKMNALGQLSAAVAHEINNPLAGVLVYTELLQKIIKGGSQNHEQILDILSKMRLAVTEVSKLVRNLLDFARQTKPDLKPINIIDVLNQVFILVGHQAELNKVKVIREDLASLPQIKGDLSQLKQVFVNLVVNAIQAMPKGGELRISNSLEKNNFLKVDVKDTGYGISPENFDKLFTPFFSTKEAVKGVGLGLAVSYGIVERHGGRIEVQSQVDKGSTFSVYLPVYNEKTDKP
jgi:signal transduction histidine kinase